MKSSFSICSACWVAGAVFVAFGCEGQSTTPRQSESRVQAVLQPAGGSAEPANAAAANAPNTKGPGQGAAEGKGSPSPVKARPPFCSDTQLSGKAFTPKQPPRKVAAKGEPALPELNFTSKRWTWVNFWAAWCVPCKQELPLLLKWKVSLGGELGFAFVSLDDDSRQLDQFLADQPATGLKSSYWLPDGPLRSAWLAPLELDSEPELPMQLLLDPSGKIRCRIEGAVEADDQTALERVIRGK